MSEGLVLFMRRSITGNDRYVFFTGTMRSDSSGPVITGPNYFDSFVLVGYPFGTDQPFLALAYVSEGPRFGSSCCGWLLPTQKHPPL